MRRSFLLANIVNVVTSLVESLLSLRILLKVLGASSGAPFVKWVYETTDPLLTPFRGMFPTPTLGGGILLEFSAIFALVAYGFLSFLIMEIVNLFDVGLRKIDKKTS